MHLTLEIVGAEHLCAGQRARHVFTEQGGSIGGSPPSDWVLMNIDKTLSSQHAQVTFQNGGFHLTELGSHGNRRLVSGLTLDRPMPRRIEPGDRFTLAGFVLRASLGEPLVVAERELGRSLPADSVVAAKLEDMHDPLFALRAREHLDNELSEAKQWRPRDATVAPLSTTSVPALSLPVPALVPPQRLEIPPVAPARAELPGAFWQQFGAALGVELGDLDDARREALALKAAALLRDSVEQLQQCLHTRDGLKADLHLPLGSAEQTRTNPIKHGTDASQALGLLLRDEAPGQLPARQALRQVYRELQAHQVGLFAASRAATHHLLDLLAPPRLAQRFEQQGRPLWGADASHWRAYQRLYQRLQKDGEWGEALFTREFATAYHEQVRLITRPPAEALTPPPPLIHQYEG